jgi:two-component system, LuxR family, sensor kinase FixL
MNWITIAWPMLAAVCLTLGLLNLTVGLAVPPRAARLLLALNSFAVAWCSAIELRLMLAERPEQFEALLWWGDIATGLVLASLAAFIWAFFHSGHKWLALAGPVLYAATLLVDFIPHGSRLTYLKITGIRTVETFRGATFNVAEGVPNPWNALLYVAVLMMLAFVVDASVRLWRRGDRKRAAIVGGSITFFYVAAGVHTSLVDFGAMRSPYLISWSYLAILVAIGYELNADIIAAVRVSLELVEGERRMDLASAAAGLGMWTWEIDGDTIWATDRARTMLGFAAGESLDLPRFMSALHPDDRDVVRHAIEGALSSGHDYEVEYRIPLPDGQIRWIAARGRVERDSRGKAILLRGAVIDTSSRHSSELEMQKLQSHLAHVGRVSSMGQLASALAHELNQPLGAILRNAEAAELFLQHETPDLDELRAILVDIRKDDRRACDVIERLRALLKRRSIEPRTVAIRDIFGNVAALTRGDSVARHITLEYKAEPQLPTVTGDQVHLQQVLLNLVLNAMDAVEAAAGGQRKVIVHADCEDGRTVCVTVRDSGCGIPPDMLKTVFEPFFTTKPSGLGVGLAISRTIVEAHGGRIWAESNAQMGATFRFTVPVAVTKTSAS